MAIGAWSTSANKEAPSVESKRVNEFANMSDEELEAYVNGD